MAEVLYFPKWKCLHFLISTPINLQLVGVEIETNGKKCLQLSILFSMHIYSLMLFVVDNLHYLQTNSSVYEIDTRYKNHLHIPSFGLAAKQWGTIHFTGKIFNQLSPRISGLKNGKKIFESALGKYLLTRFLFHRRIFITRTAIV